MIERNTKKERKEDSSDFSKALLFWYDNHKRSLPWREDPTPYHIWLSEIMLQQTKVEAVKGYYTRFLKALPTLRDLAEADEDVCLKLWEGLGYYNRIRNFKKAAMQIMSEYNGKIPGTYDELLTLAGVGPYTAAALASIGFGEPVPAIDGNLLRVYSRLEANGESIFKTSMQKSAKAYYDNVIALDRPGAFNQALMDLGATVCLANTMPLCESCPLKDFCKAHASGTQTDYPNRPKKTKRKIDKMTVFVIRFDNGILLRKRPNTGLLAGLYELPNTEGYLTESEALSYVEELGFEPLRINRLPQAKHVFSHREWHMHAYEIQTSGWKDFTRRKPQRISEASTEVASLVKDSGEDMKENVLEDMTEDVANEIFLADPTAVNDTWSIPSAFQAYREYLLK